MPSRHRPKSKPAAPSQPAAGQPARSGGSVQSDVERFAAALKESEQLDRAKRERQQQAKAAAEQAAADAATHERSLATARRDLERAVEAVRHAKQVGKGRADADAAWKVAKARVIELETGVAPAWAPKPPPEPEVEATDDEPAETDGVDTAD